MRREVKMAGFGGQGIVLMGVILAEAAGYYEGLEIAQTQSYGPEARGERAGPRWCFPMRLSIIQRP